MPQCTSLHLLLCSPCSPRRYFREAECCTWFWQAIKDLIQGLTFQKKPGAQPLSLNAWAAAGKSMSGVCKKVDLNLWYHGNPYQVAVVKRNKQPVTVRQFNHEFWDAIIPMGRAPGQSA